MIMTIDVEMKGDFNVEIEEIEEEGKVGEGGWDPSAVNSVLESLTHAMEQSKIYAHNKIK